MQPVISSFQGEQTCSMWTVTDTLTDITSMIYNTTVHGIIDDLTLIIESSFFKEKSDFVSTCHKIVIS